MATTYKTVDAFLQDQLADRRDAINVLREIVLSARPGVTEVVKWNSPSYVYNENDRITVKASAKDAVRLIFHAGVETLPKVPIAGQRPVKVGLRFSWKERKPSA